MRGGGSIPLEAQRLGLQALAGDLNPVAVLINKAMIEIPPRFAGLPPVHPDIDTSLKTWERAQGLAADVEAYGRWMRDEAQRRIGHLYPDATGPDGEKLTPIAWIWARTVESPNPSWFGHVPLVASWVLRNKKGKPTVWIEPIIDRETQTISYEVREGGEPTPERTVIRGNGTCIATGAAIPNAYIKAEGRAGRMKSQLMAVVAEGQGGKIYCSPQVGDTAGADIGLPTAGLPTESIAANPRYMLPPLYGMNEWHKLFTPRQLVALTTFSDLLTDVAANVRGDAARAGLSAKGARLRDNGAGSIAYADAIVTYLAFVIDKCADYWSSICTWQPGSDKVGHTFGMHALPIAWNYAESNPFSNSSGRMQSLLRAACLAIGALPSSQHATGTPNTTDMATQQDARTHLEALQGVIISTDPPYYDNVPFADISDFFFMWLRQNLSEVWPAELGTLSTPKADELVADRMRAGSLEAANRYFESGIGEFVHQVYRQSHRTAPATIYYAFKATEKHGWATFLQAVVDSGIQVAATWPMRTERGTRLRNLGSNALASSIVLACRPRPERAPMATRGEFIAALRRELPEAVRLLQTGNIAPVDMAQSTIGPGIRVFSRYAKVVETDGSAMPVSAALGIINDVLGEVLDGEEAELDADTRFALSWYAEFEYRDGAAGDAESMAKAKNTSLEGLQASGIGTARAGKFRLYTRSELEPDWNPAQDDRFTVWEALQHLVATLERSETEAAELLHTLGGHGERARQLAYLLYQKADEKGWSAEANAYNGLITAWPNLREGALAAADRATAPVEDELFTR